MRQHLGPVKLLNMVAVLTALAAASILIASDSHARIPEPRPHNIGFAAAAIDYRNGDADLGSVTASTFNALMEYAETQPHALFEPDGLNITPPPQDDVKWFPTSPRSYSLFYLLSFVAFGYSLSSVIILWALVFFAGVVLAATMARTVRAANSVVYTTCGVVVLLGAIPLMDINVGSVINYRLAPLLVVVPATALVFGMLDGIQTGWTSPAVLGALIGFTLAVRPTVVWIPLLLTGLILRGLLAEWRSSSNRWGTLSKPLVAVATIAISGSFFLTMQNRVPDGLEQVEAIADSVRWNSIAIGLLRDPRLHEAYACSDQEFDTSLRGIRHQPCANSNVSPSGSLAETAFPVFRYDDQHAYSAALRYIKDNNLDIDLGLGNELDLFGDLSGFNMNWRAYGEVMQLVVVSMVRNDLKLVGQAQFGKTLRLVTSAIFDFGSIAAAASEKPASRLTYALWAVAFGSVWAANRLGMVQKCVNIEAARGPERRASCARAVSAASGIALMAILATAPSLIFYPILHAQMDLYAILLALIGALVSSRRDSCLTATGSPRRCCAHITLPEIDE